MTEAHDSWTQLPCGSVVVRELPTQDWMVSWYPNEGDPNYPGFTMLLSEKGVQEARPPEIRPAGMRVLPAHACGREEDDAGEEAATYAGADHSEAAGGGAAAGRGQAGSGGGEGARGV